MHNFTSQSQANVLVSSEKPVWYFQYPLFKNPQIRAQFKAECISEHVYALQHTRCLEDGWTFTTKYPRPLSSILVKLQEATLSILTGSDRFNFNYLRTDKCNLQEWSSCDPAGQGVVTQVRERTRTCHKGHVALTLQTKASMKFCIIFPQVAQVLVIP